jgi:hypothetical protein
MASPKKAVFFLIRIAARYMGGAKLYLSRQRELRDAQGETVGKGMARRLAPDHCVSGC